MILLYFSSKINIQVLGKNTQNVIRRVNVFCISLHFRIRNESNINFSYTRGGEGLGEGWRMGDGRRLMRGGESETLSGLSCFTSYYEQNIFEVVFFCKWYIIKQLFISCYAIRVIFKLGHLSIYIFWTFPSFSAGIGNFTFGCKLLLL